MLSPAFPSDSRTLSGLADSDLDVFVRWRFGSGNATLPTPLIKVYQYIEHKKRRA